MAKVISGAPAPTPKSKPFILPLAVMISADKKRWIAAADSSLKIYADLLEELRGWCDPPEDGPALILELEFDEAFFEAAAPIRVKVTKND